MPEYRVYSLDPAGKIMGAEWIEADSDEAAVETARSRRDAGAPAVEVWCGKRRVAVIPRPPDAPG